MAEKLVTIKKFGSYIEAELAKQHLDDCGLRSVVTGQNAANAYAELAAVASSSLQVFESQAQKALEILKPEKQQED